MKKITLEMSLKPFKRTDSDYVRSICRTVFMQWNPLIKNAEEISILLWTADGSEILDYDGDLNTPFAWCCYIGTANKPLLGKTDRKDLSLHEKKQFYMENPPVMTYRILKTIVRILKEEGKKMYPTVKITVGETFDIGPEFAVSDFKYERHKEIVTGTKFDGDKKGFIDATAHLCGDNRQYAAYPNGIPDGTPFGLFFGRQANVFLKDMGFDYVWLSNGLGFSADPWLLTGKIYDGEHFYPNRLQKTKTEVFEFWKFFRQGCPDVLVETRGTNNSVGIDYATDGVPLYDIYTADLNIMPPPNSPWAALNDDVGLEIMGHMSRIADIPGDTFLFRYYLHDPWWVNSPWYDRYGQSAHDIYLPMAISRIDADGSVQTAGQLNILSIDNSYGELPDSCADEVIPHLKKAEKDKADAAAPFVWIYPVREYTTSADKDLLREMYFGDRYIKDSVNVGFPLNCVTSADSFLQQNLSVYAQSVIVSPVPPEKAVFEKLNGFAKEGGRVMVYGSKAALAVYRWHDNVILCDTESDSMTDKMRILGYKMLQDGQAKKAVFSVHRSNNAFFFSAYVRDTTAVYRMRFPQGVPILLNTETQVREGSGVYRFSRFEHRECRVFVEQNDGKIFASECAPVNGYYRRRINIEGLKDAVVRIYPETYCTDTCRIADADVPPDATPQYIDGFECFDDAFGKYLKAEHVSGNIAIYMPKKNV